MDYYIYALRCPDTYLIRYIGKTNNCDQREDAHIYKLGNTLKDKWIKKLKQEGKKPYFDIIEICEESNWHEREMYYIEMYNTEQNQLLNTYKGIKYRTDTNVRKKIQDILVNGKYYLNIIKHKEFLSKKIVIEVAQDQYMIVNGNSNRKYKYNYINSRGFRYYIPKTSSLYKQNELPILEGKINLKFDYF